MIKKLHPPFLLTGVGPTAEVISEPVSDSVSREKVGNIPRKCTRIQLHLTLKSIFETEKWLLVKTKNIVDR